MVSTKTVDIKEYAEAIPIQWCPGCGNFGMLRAMRQALVALNLEPYQVLMVSGIGQAGKFPHFTHSHVINELHGRALPAATAAKLVNPELSVIVMGGDGDGYGEGGNHFLAAMHRNVDMMYVVHNNQVYGLTKGQASPTSDEGYISKTTPEGAWAPYRGLALAVASDCSFVARGFAGDIPHLSHLFQEGIKHRGFALIEVLQPCVIFNHVNTFSWYRQRAYKVDEEAGYDPGDRIAAFKHAIEWGDHIPIGIIYRKERPLYEEHLPALSEGPLIKQKLDPFQVDRLLDEFL